ncbi:MAG: enoyl-CoA hydratase/isomerase family protein [Deltaproteobacteria bacterium]|jgi:enoyl-CoA hydratase/carnithine racemase|nr:enoyl-CoA hydratase/isomerase family protein [Deltaproteobacteria bacterium]
MSNLPEFQTLVCKKEQAILTVELNRPDKLNAFNEMMFGDVARIAEIASSDSEVRIVVFKGRGRAFSSGADLTELSGGITEIDDNTLEQHIRAAQQVMDQVEAISQPTIAAIHGPAVGAGFQLALACDFRIAVKGIKVGLSDVKIGILPALGATTRLPKLIGLAKSKELIMSGNLITSEDAYQMGLLTELVEAEMLDESVYNLAKNISRSAPLALSAAKQLLNSEAPLDHAAAEQVKLFKSGDAHEGIAAFLEKRKPVFKGS